MDYSNWKRSDITVTNVMLDPENSRIVIADDTISQNELIYELVMYEKVYHLAKSIAEDGYFPTELLLAIKKNNKYVILEGNRRITAMKLLLNPESSPDLFKARFRVLSQRVNKSIIKKVRAVIAPNRESAAKLLESRHSAPQIEGWSPLAKGKFYYGQLVHGISIKEVSAQYNISEPRMRRYLRLYTIYNYAHTLDLDETTRESVIDPRKFSSTNLERFLNFKDVRDSFGIEFEDGDIVGHIDENEFRKGLKSIVTDIATGKIQSRDINNKDDALKVLNKLKYKPDLSKVDSFRVTPKSALEGISHKTEKVLRPKVKKARVRKSKSLVPSNFKCEVNNIRISNIFKELKELSAKKYPNAVSILLRALLEMGLTYHLEKTGYMSTLIRDLSQKNRLGPKKQPSLRQMLIYVTDNNGIISSSNLKRALKKFLSQKDSIFSLETLNEFVHNEQWLPTEDMLRVNWNQLEAFFEIILTEPEFLNS